MSDEQQPAPTDPATRGQSAAAPSAPGPAPAGEDGLVARLDVIEEQPLEARADAYAHLHEQLRRTLEGDDEHGRS
ncbi:MULTISPECIES: hypothetical protein [unclassified Leifsonia]|uniref:hypothetical protein n=1 Tax=unclassified Leifsonia TaxID=2663824 RepID=UPI0011133782|nr:MULTISPECIES: hypothetical protein [unclassified Leifsonia]